MIRRSWLTLIPWIILRPCVDHGIMAITVTAEPTDENATRKIMVGDGDDAVVYEDGAVPLEVGLTKIDSRSHG